MITSRKLSMFLISIVALLSMLCDIKPTSASSLLSSSSSFIVEKSSNGHDGERRRKRKRSNKHRIISKEFRGGASMDDNDSLPLPPPPPSSSSSSGYNDGRRQESYIGDFNNNNHATASYSSEGDDISDVDDDDDEDMMIRKGRNNNFGTENGGPSSSEYGTHPYQQHQQYGNNYPSGQQQHQHQQHRPPYRYESQQQGGYDHPPHQNQQYDNQRPPQHHYQQQRDPYGGYGDPSQSQNPYMQQQQLQQSARNGNHNNFKDDIPDLPGDDVYGSQQNGFHEEPSETRGESFSNVSTDKVFSADISLFDKNAIYEGLKRMYRKKILPLELASKYGHFHSPPLSPSDFDAKPMVLLLGQYSVGKTSFIKYLLGRDFPGIRIGPEPTTDRFTAIMEGEVDKVIPGAALASQADRSFRGLSPFGNNFLSRLEGVEVRKSLTFSCLKI